MRKFNEKQLYEIEKIFDHAASQIGVQHANNLMQLKGIKSKKLDKHLTKMFDWYVESFDMYRTISAVAANMRESFIKSKD